MNIMAWAIGASTAAPAPMVPAGTVLQAGINTNLEEGNAAIAAAAALSVVVAIVPPADMKDKPPHRRP